MLTLPAVLMDKHGLPFTVRRYTPADRAALEAMYRSFEPKRGAQGLPPKEAGIARWLDTVLPRGVHVIIAVDREVLGHGMVVPMEDGRLELANFLHQDIRNRGIGTAVNRIAMQLARDTGAERLWLCVEPSNRAAVRSYEKAGFRRLPGSLWSPEIEMEAELTSPG